MVQTPVGARCPSCAGLRRLPTYQISGLMHFQALAIGVGLAVVFGFLLRFTLPYVWFFSFVLVVLMGYATGELISLAVNRKRGLGLQVIAGASTLLVGLLLVFVLGGHLSIYGWIALALAVYVAVQRLR
ncbi:hypothetical protein ACFLVD_00510 [Chloroflexota bacterium]